MFKNAISCKNKIAHFQRMRHLPRHQPHDTAGPNTGGNVCLIDVRLKARVLLPKRTTKQPGERSPSGLSIQASTPTKQLIRNSSLGMRLAITEPSF